jgi:hypothetical protein
MSMNGFKDEEGRENSRGGRLKTARNPGTIAKFGYLLVGHGQMTLKLMKDQLHINRNTSRQIPHEDMGKRKICANCSTQTDGQAKGAQGHVLRRLHPDVTRHSSHFLNCVVIGDAETRRQSVDWGK